MKPIIVMKFGGGVLNSAANIKRLPKIVRSFREAGYDVVIVVSAIGKTTNILEKVANKHWQWEGAFQNELTKDYAQVFESHRVISKELQREMPVKLLSDLANRLFQEPDKCFPAEYYYDQIVSFGERLSAQIVSSCLGVEMTEAFKFIITDNCFQKAGVNLNLSEERAKEIISQVLAENNGLVVTYGFVGGFYGWDEYTPVKTTLGRESSDYVAGLLGYFLNAKAVILWKDVPGVCKADPNENGNATELIEKMSYSEAIFMFRRMVGNRSRVVVHPETIEPLRKKNVPLQIRPFYNPVSEGTLIS